MRAIAAALAGLALASCDAPSADNSDEAPQAPEPPKTPISIRTLSGGPKQEAFLVEPMRDIPLDQLAEAVRETGNRCERVTSFKRLEQSGAVMDVYKLDCGARVYQMTVLEGSTHIKRWTGNIVGQ